MNRYNKPAYRKSHEAAYKKVRVVMNECQCGAIYWPYLDKCPKCGGKPFLVDTFNEKKER